MNLLGHDSLFQAEDTGKGKRIVGTYFCITVLLGAAEVLACRREITPDSMDYLDVARELSSGHWGAVWNGYWGTLISVLLAPIVRLKVSPSVDLLLAHSAGLIILIASFLAFTFFLDSLISSDYIQVATAPALSPWSLRLLGYALFLWTSVTMVGVSSIGPDLLVTLFVYLDAAILIRSKANPGCFIFALFGAVLGIGYWAKAIMFPVGLIFLGVSILQTRKWKLHVLSLAAFAILAAPLVLMLSLPRGRFTFGDSGLLNYSSFVSPGGRVINWHGEPAGSGVPKHPTRKIADHPPIYEFNGPIGGTYPPSYDPSYWNEGRKATIGVRVQLKTFMHHVPNVVELLFVSQPALIAVLVFLLLWNSTGILHALAANWELLAISMAIIGLYMLVHFEPRFVAAFVVLLWLSLFAALRSAEDNDSGRISGLASIGLALAVTLSVVSNVAKKFAHDCPQSALKDLQMAQQLDIPGGSKVAVVGAGNFSYWAYFADLRIVADIMAPDETEFWSLSEDRRQALYPAFRSTGAKWLIGQPPACLGSLSDTLWKRVGTTNYYLYALTP